MYLNPHTPTSFPFWVSPWCAYPFLLVSRILFSLESGHRELRVLKTGYLKTLPVILGQGCPLSADWYGVVVVLLFLFFFVLFLYKNKIPFTTSLFPFLGDILVMGER